MFTVNCVDLFRNLLNNLKLLKMKKKNLKVLLLSKRTVSDLQTIIGGAKTGGMSCRPPVKPLTDVCNNTNGTCDSRLGGCPSYYYCG